MEIANWLDFRFFFALGALPCYPWIAPKKSSEARLAAGLSHFPQSSTNFWHGTGKTVLGQLPGMELRAVLGRDYSFPHVEGFLLSVLGRYERTA